MKYFAITLILIVNVSLSAAHAQISSKFDQAMISIRFNATENKMFFKQVGQEIVFVRE